jgi:hypothetical protein
MGRELMISVKEFSKTYLSEKSFKLSKSQKRLVERYSKDYKLGQRLIIPVPRRILGL